MQMDAFITLTVCTLDNRGVRFTAVALYAL